MNYRARKLGPIHSMGLKTQPISDPIRPGPEGSVCLIRCISIMGQEEKGERRGGGGEWGPPGSYHYPLFGYLFSKPIVSK